MLDVIMQSITLAILLGALWWGYRQWVQPRHGTTSLQGRGLLILIVLTFMGGLIGSPFWWFDEPRSFSWDLPPLASRMLAAAGWSFAVVTWLVLQRPTPRRTRLALVLLATYLAPLVVAILLFHLDRFNFRAPITYAFFAISGGMSIAALWFLLRRPIVLSDQASDNAPTRRRTSIWLGLVALPTACWGAALFATDAGPWRLIWAWPGDLLSSRLIGVMLLTIAVGSALSLRFADQATLMLAMTTTYGLGVAIANLWNVLVGRPINMAYLLGFSVMLAGSAALLVKERSERLTDSAFSTIRSI
jgi:hypothetical protein